MLAVFSLVQLVAFAAAVGGRSRLVVTAQGCSYVRDDVQLAA